jgi:FKBP-type peptidyl-prolyl cis-trans isomerase 2
MKIFLQKNPAFRLNSMKGSTLQPERNASKKANIAVIPITPTGIDSSIFFPKYIYNTKHQFFMQAAKSGDTVKVHYHGRLTTGETFDSSQGREPLEFTIGSGMVIKGFDDGVTGMLVGDKKTIEIPVDEAYGPVNEQMIFEFPRTNIPPDMEISAGMQLMMNNGAGQQMPVVVLEVKEEIIVMDANHPLAGQDLIFDLEMVAIAPGKSSIILEP